ncbi:helix-turn-helix domain-containing protein [Streptomyces sp. NPDC048489]|uniref:helix-turn-helix domain-containing protein n=1 Tax=Streptomyces sp. NPDC048489 TaxID=3154504 RepID=UPI003423A73E
MDGLASARARGRVGGRRPRLTEDQAALAQRLYDEWEKTVQQIADMFGVPRSTVYGHLDKTKTVPVSAGRPRSRTPDARLRLVTGFSPVPQLAAVHQRVSVAKYRAALRRMSRSSSSSRILLRAATSSA